MTVNRAPNRRKITRSTVKQAVISTGKGGVLQTDGFCSVADYRLSPEI